jgi:hypothetical protein
VQSRVPWRRAVCCIMLPACQPCLCHLAAPPLRRELLPEYKSGRERVPAEFHPDLSNLQQLLRCLRVATLVSTRGYEADDVMAGLARQASAAGWSTTLVSSDRDLWQVRPCVRRWLMHVPSPAAAACAVGRSVYDTRAALVALLPLPQLVDDSTGVSALLPGGGKTRPGRRIDAAAVQHDLGVAPCQVRPQPGLDSVHRHSRRSSSGSSGVVLWPQQVSHLVMLLASPCLHVRRCPTSRPSQVRLSGVPRWEHAALLNARAAQHLPSCCA